MKLSKFPRILVGAFLTCALSLPLWGQISAERIAAIDQTLQAAKASYDRMPPNKQMLLAGGAANAAHLADMWQRMGTRLAGPGSAVNSPIPSLTTSPAKPSRSPIVPVSAAGAAHDLNYSPMSGFTQSSTSSARCGNNVVVGFEDTGSWYETPVSGNYYYSGGSSTGYAYSSDGGQTFADGGAVNPGPYGTDPQDWLLGEPVVACGDANTFSYVQLMYRGIGRWSVAMNISTDGGKTFASPIPAVTGSETQVLDKPWLAVDPSNPNNIYVSYFAFDSNPTGGVCKTQPPSSAIQFVASHDGGHTWDKPKTVYEVCGNAAVSGSQIAVDSKGNVYVAWINFGSNFPIGPRSLQIATNRFGDMSIAYTVATVQPVGDSYFLQGVFRDFLDMALAVDHSGGPTDGFVYVTWADGRDKMVTDPVAIQGVYAYADVFVNFSPDGIDWSPLAIAKVNSDFQGTVGSGHDHFQPGVAVDKTGTVAVCWYDRRNDSENFAIQRYCGTSTDYGAYFTNINTGMPAFAPTHGTDEFLLPTYMGSYDQPSSDFLNQNAGFFSAFQSQGRRGNPDVVGFRF